MVDSTFIHSDDFYAALLDVHGGLSLAESHALNARLVLILAHQVGDMDRLRAALAAAREGAHEGAHESGHESANPGVPDHAHEGPVP